MKYHTLFLSKTRKDVTKSAAVVIGALRVNVQGKKKHHASEITIRLALQTTGQAGF